MGKDRQGKWRGRCTAVDCVCSIYTKEDLADKLRCDYCDHPPGVHILLGKCTGCDQCDGYEVDEEEPDGLGEEEPDGLGECSYCGCSPKEHEVKKTSAVLQSGSTVTPAIRPATAPAIPPTHPPATGLTHPTAFASQYGYLCKLPGCQKPCFVEGHKVHDFCGRTHASAYSAMYPGGPGGFGGFGIPRVPGGLSGPGGPGGPGGFGVPGGPGTGGPGGYGGPVSTQPRMPQPTPRPTFETMHYSNPSPSSGTMQPASQPPLAGPSATSPPPRLQTQVGEQAPLAPGDSSRPKCRNPQCQRPCYVEGSKVFDYCGKSCRNAHAS